MKEITGCWALRAASSEQGRSSVTVEQWYNDFMPTKRLTRADWWALAGLSLAVLAVYARVLLTPLVPASGDFLTYFTPYWQQLNQALRWGHLPLWNDFIFAGAPFQANPQTEVFYPLRWPMIFLSAEKGILLTAALHAWLAGIFGYFWTKKLINRGSVPALVAALILALNGWVTGLLLHPNQISTYPWLVAALLLWEHRPSPGQWPRWHQRVRRWGVLMALVWSLAFLAGHTQSFYNAAVIFSLWLLADVLWRAFQRQDDSWRNRLADMWPVALVAMLAAGLVAAVQLLPTLELAGLSYRQGGLGFREHAALSLPPWRLGFTLLPHYARDLGAALGTEAYGEWLGYVGLTGLLLALLGLRRTGRARRMGLFLSMGGLLLALGAYDPLEYLLFRLVPGWNLFRVPARFLQMTMLGLALLAGSGTAQLTSAQAWWPTQRRQWMGWVAIVALLLLAASTRPTLITLLGWSATLILLMLIVAAQGLFKTKLKKRPLGLLPLVLGMELFAASYALPIQHPTAPQAVRSWRTAPAAIAAEQARSCRTLSLSTTTWDPGDLQDLRQLYGPSLDDKAFTDFINATKAKEVVAPNLGVLFGIPSLDGFGGGVLPTARFVQAMQLFLPRERIVADGRLREQLHSIPPQPLLSLFNVCYVITDKTFDVWHEDVYYDLALGETLDASRPELRITDLPSFPVSGLGLVSHLGPEAAQLALQTAVAQVTLIFDNGSRLTLPVRAGVETMVGADDVRSSPGSLAAVRWPRHEPGQDAIARLNFPQARIREIRFELLRDDVSLFLRGAAVYNAKSGAHATPVVSRAPWRRIHSGDVKIYRNDGVLPRAFAVARVQPVAHADAALAVMQEPTFRPEQVAVVMAEDSPNMLPSGPLSPARIQILQQGQGRLHLHYQADAESLVVVANAWHPGWQGVLDQDSSQARAVAIFPVDLFLQGVLLPAGEHDLLLTFQPRSLRSGGLITLLALSLLAWLWIVPPGKG